MSVEVMSQVFRRYPGGGGERLLALALADCANADGTRIWPSVKTLAQMSAQSERSVQRQLTAMLASGWLVMVRKTSGGAGSTNEYRICADWLAGGNPTPPSRAPTRDIPSARKGDKLTPLVPADNAPKGDTAMSPSRVTSATNKGDTAMSPDPSIPVINTKPPHAPPSGGSRDVSQTEHAAGADGYGGSDGRSGSDEADETDAAEGAGSSAALGAAFDELARLYPRKVALQAARREFERIAPDAALQRRMLATVGAWNGSEEWKREAGRFVPKLDRWLRENRWNDVPGNSAPVQSPVVVPLPPRRELTPEQLAENGRMAREAIAAARRKFTPAPAARADGFERTVAHGA